MVNCLNFSSSWKSKKNSVKESDRSLVHEAVTDDEIARIISRWTGIPVTKLTEGERTKLLGLEDELHKRVIGQDEGVTSGNRCYPQIKSRYQRPDETYWFIPVSWSYRCW